MSRDVRELLREAAPQVETRPDLVGIERRAAARRRRRRAGTAIASAVVVATAVAVGTWLGQGQPRAPIIDLPKPVPTAPSATGGPFDNIAFEIGPLSPRGGHSVVWTGAEMIVWGGAADPYATTLFDDGAAFDSETGQWRTIAPSPLTPRLDHVAVWTGTEMLIVGGDHTASGAAYDPAADRWRALPDAPRPVDATRTGAVWTNDRLLLWYVADDQVVAYTPASDSWQPLPPVGLQAARGVLRWSGQAVYALGFQDVFPDTVPLVAVRLTGDQWQRLPDATFATPKYDIAASPELTAWAAGRMIGWTDSGSDGRTLVFDPSGDQWRDAAPTPVNGCEAAPAPLVIDDRVLAFGWCGNSAIYDPASDAWTPANIDGLGQDRYAVWTGREVLTWGDTCCYGTGEPFTVRAWRYTPPPPPGSRGSVPPELAELEVAVDPQVAAPGMEVVVSGPSGGCHGVEIGLSPGARGISWGRLAAVIDAGTFRATFAMPDPDLHGGVPTSSIAVGATCLISGVPAAVGQAHVTYP